MQKISLSFKEFLDEIAGYQETVVPEVVKEEYYTEYRYKLPNSVVIERASNVDAYSEYEMEVFYGERN